MPRGNSTRRNETRAVRQSSSSTVLVEGPPALAPRAIEYRQAAFPSSSHVRSISIECIEFGLKKRQDSLIDVR